MMKKRLILLVCMVLPALGGSFDMAAMRPYKTPAQVEAIPQEEMADEVLPDSVQAASLQADTLFVEEVSADTLVAEVMPEPERPDIRPAPLRPGDCVGIFTISNYADSVNLRYGISMLQKWGLRVRLADNLFKRNGRYDGTLEERIKATQALIDDPDVKAMISVRGGYGAALTTPYLDYSPLMQNPKWIIGYSDVTALHIVLNNMGVETIHGPMATRVEGDTVSTNFLHEALFGEAPGLVIPSNLYCREGEAVGRLVGGNLSLIYSLQGTPMELDMKDAILFIEDVDEDSYAIDRMMQNLLLSGKLDEIAGIIVGQFTNFDDAKGMDLTLPQIIYSKIGDRQIPVMYQIDAGHEWNASKSAPNYSLYLGRKIHLKVDRDMAYFEYVD